MTRLIAALIIAAQITSPASAAIPGTGLPHTASATCAPVTILETRGDWARVTMGENFGWVRLSEIETTRCALAPGLALDASYRPREAATSAFA